MLSKLRDHIPVIMWIVIVTFIGTIFLSWGMNVTGRQEEPVIAKVEGKKILLRNFERLVSIERERMRMQSGGELTPQQNSMIPRQVFEREVGRILLEKISDEMNIGSSADEVYAYLKDNPPPEIVSHPFFLTETDSTFDTSRYIQFLNNPNQVQQLVSIEEHIRSNIIPMMKVKYLLEASAAPSNLEIKREYHRFNDRAVFEYARAVPSQFSIDSNEISDRMIESYYNANQDSFYHDSQSDLYYVKVPKVPTSGDSAMYIDELQNIKERIENGEAQFDQEARIMSDDPNAEKSGGSLGTFTHGSMVPEFEEAAFSLEEGEISDPVVTKFGYHLILVENREERGDSVYITASHILRKIIPSIETLDTISELLDTVHEEAVESGLKTAVKAKGTGLALDSTGLFTREDRIPGLGFAYGAKSFAFNNDEGTISEILEDDEAFYILEIKRRTKKGVLSFDNVRDKIYAILVRDKQNDMAKEYLEKTVSLSGDGNSISDIGQNDSRMNSGITDTVTRVMNISSLGRGTKACAAAFALRDGMISDIIEGENSFSVVRTLWKEIEKEINWESPDVKAIRSQLTQKRKNKAYIEWYSFYKEQANVVDRLNEYYMF